MAAGCGGAKKVGVRIAVESEWTVGAEFYRQLPRKRMAAGVLICNERSEILLVKPIYRKEWLTPGGVIEKGESPRQACARELREELGLDIGIGRLLCLEYVSGDEVKGDALMFIFDGGILSNAQLERIVLPEEELSTFRFMPLRETEALLPVKAVERVRQAVRALNQGEVVYLEDGETCV